MMRLAYLSLAWFMLSFAACDSSEEVQDPGGGAGGGAGGAGGMAGGSGDGAAAGTGGAAGSGGTADPVPQGTILADGLCGLLQIEIDATDVFVYGLCGVDRVSKTDGTVANVAAVGQNGAIAVDDIRLYFATASGVGSVPKGGGSTISYSSATSTAVAVDADRVYWAVQPSWDSAMDSWANDAEIRSALKTGGDETLMLEGARYVGAMAHDNGILYFGVDYGNKGVRAIPVSGGTVQSLVPNTNVRRLRARNGTLFVAANDTACAVELPAGTVHTFESPGQVLGADGDANRIYYTSLSPSKVYAADKDGGSAEVIAEWTGHSTLALDVVADDQRVYWITEDETASQGRVMYIDKP
jgi:hypothetical protein